MDFFFTRLPSKPNYLMPNLNSVPRNSSRYSRLKTQTFSYHAIPQSCHDKPNNVPRNLPAMYLDILYESIKHQKKVKLQKSLKVFLRAQNNYYPLRNDNARRPR